MARGVSTWTDARDARLVQRYRDGATTRAIAAELGVNQSTVESRVRTMVDLGRLTARRRAPTPRAGAGGAETSAAWPAADVALLAELWGKGLSGAEIGKRLRRSKNAVVGKAHRLGLDGRASPIKEADPNRPPDRRLSATRAAEIAGFGKIEGLGKIEGFGKTETGGAIPPPRAVDCGEGAASCEPAPFPPRPLHETGDAAETRPPGSPIKSGMTAERGRCQWPFPAADGPGQDSGTSFDCEAPRVHGKPYCAAHCKRAFLRPKAREADHGRAYRPRYSREDAA